MFVTDSLNPEVLREDIDLDLLADALSTVAWLHQRDRFSESGLDQTHACP